MRGRRVPSAFATCVQGAHGLRRAPARVRRALQARPEHPRVRGVLGACGDPGLCALRMKCKYSAHLHVEPNKQGKRRIMGLIDDKQKETG